MSEAPSIFNARFIGRRSVEGPLHDRALSQIVSDLNKSPRDHPCHLEWTESSLCVHYFAKKDEGFFESDGDSLKSSDEKPPPPRIPKGSFSEGEESDTSSANSSGTDSSSDENLGSRLGNSPSFEHKESYPLSDVLICHADRDHRKCVIWIVRKGPRLEAIVFECPSEERVRDLYREYQEGHRRSKLDHRASSVGKRLTGSAECILEECPKRGMNHAPPSQTQHHRHSAHGDSLRKWNLFHHTDSDGVTHIEVKSDKSKFTRELESILSKEGKKVPHNSKTSENGKKTLPGDHLSLRQRAPALLLRKFDEIEEKVYGSWSKGEEDRRVWSKGKPQHSKRSDHSKQILVPTKTGAEPVKKLYPKDQAPSHDRLLRNIPPRYLAMPPSSIQFATSSQPHSLPLYHVGHHVAWAYPLDHLQESLWSNKRASSSLIGGSSGGGSSRVSRERTTSERRRAQSKSPARTEGNISRVWREFGDAVKNRMSRKSSTNSVSFPDVAHLKSNLKKPPEASSSSGEGTHQLYVSPSSLIMEENGGSSDKKVHFNKFATVQMME
eukprot:TRINITY_DN7168_c0_g1_i1.p1 TRINITY_DN7168_c0_g1~~TRINITY_DN7168_c0_g1_i1.p1  ORF type:complete len:552 (+),score=99.01 TRINITY_DN7168_c0_g1_i1:439-2094(+)